MDETGRVSKPNDSQTLLKAPKFGNDIDEVDELVKDVFDSYLELLPNYTTLRTGKGPEVSCYTMSTFEYYFVCTKWLCGRCNARWKNGWFSIK